eukprot:TRINITY_DN2238_c0_g1_i1.p1 TRINITY_DN2238_c0_g1~~TRINITY_DN2238_c0_g1_i1.p1  ORF type:complete len:153 (+),score=34.23 TRINITY_DN2238_c0_g1_i1:79-537(+)
MASATSVSASVLAAQSFCGAPVETKSSLAGSSLPSLALSPSSRSKKAFRLTVTANAPKKIKTNQPYGPSGNTKFRDGLDASGRKQKGKGVYQFTNKYGANVDGYSPIFTPDEWSANGDTYAAGTQGLLLWAVTLGALILGGALLIFNTSALS